MHYSAACGVDPAEWLRALDQAPAGDLKRLAQDLIRRIGLLAVVPQRTGLTRWPLVEARGRVQRAVGEVPVAEALVRIPGGEGYGACRGQDLELAVALAVIDAAAAAGVAAEEIAAFVRAHAAPADELTLARPR
jgi:alpha-D-ribose 1-methylphosphonate 5-triphosphate synthase subunit PhnG